MNVWTDCVNKLESVTNYVYNCQMRHVLCISNENQDLEFSYDFTDQSVTQKMSIFTTGNVQSKFGFLYDTRTNVEIQLPRYQRDGPMFMRNSHSLKEHVEKNYRRKKSNTYHNLKQPFQ